MYCQYSFAAVSFLTVVGYLIDQFRRSGLVELWVAAEHVRERALPRRILKQFEEALNNILGHRILSVRSAISVLVWSVPINALIWTLYFVRTSETSSSLWSIVTGNFLGLTIWLLPFAYIHDYLSVCVTRVLLRRVTSLNRPRYALLPFLLIDVLLALYFIAFGVCNSIESHVGSLRR